MYTCHRAFRGFEWLYSAIFIYVKQFNNDLCYITHSIEIFPDVKNRFNTRHEKYSCVFLSECRSRIWTHICAWNYEIIEKPDPHAFPFTHDFILRTPEWLAFMPESSTRYIKLSWTRLLHRSKVLDVRYEVDPLSNIIFSAPKLWAPLQTAIAKRSNNYF